MKVLFIHMVLFYGYKFSNMSIQGNENSFFCLKLKSLSQKFVLNRSKTHYFYKLFPVLLRVPKKPNWLHILSVLDFPFWLPSPWYPFQHHHTGFLQCSSSLKKLYQLHFKLVLIHSLQVFSCISGIFSLRRYLVQQVIIINAFMLSCMTICDYMCSIFDLMNISAIALGSNVYLIYWLFVQRLKVSTYFRCIDYMCRGLKQQGIFDLLTICIRRQAKSSRGIFLMVHAPMFYKSPLGIFLLFYQVV